MKSNVSKLIVAVYSIIFGAIGFIGPISYGPAWLVYIVQSLMIVVGIVLLIPPFKKAIKIRMIIALVFYSLTVVMGGIVLFIIPLVGAVIFAMMGVPFAFSIVSLVLLQKEIRVTKRTPR